MTVSQKDIQKAQQVGAQNGHVNTAGMSSADKQQIDKAVKDGQGR